LFFTLTPSQIAIQTLPFFFFFSPAQCIGPLPQNREVFLALVSFSRLFLFTATTLFFSLLSISPILRDCFTTMRNGTRAQCVLSPVAPRSRSNLYPDALMRLLTKGLPPPFVLRRLNLQMTIMGFDPPPQSRELCYVSDLLLF